MVLKEKKAKKQKKKRMNLKSKVHDTEIQKSKKSDPLRGIRIAINQNIGALGLFSEPVAGCIGLAGAAVETGRVCPKKSSQESTNDKLDCNSKCWLFDNIVDETQVTRENRKMGGGFAKGKKSWLYMLLYVVCLAGNQVDAVKEETIGLGLSKMLNVEKGMMEMVQDLKLPTSLEALRRGIILISLANLLKIAPKDQDDRQRDDNIKERNTFFHIQFTDFNDGNTDPRCRDGGISIVWKHYVEQMRDPFLLVNTKSDAKERLSSTNSGVDFSKSKRCITHCKRDSKFSSVLEEVMVNDDYSVNTKSDAKERLSSTTSGVDFSKSKRCNTHCKRDSKFSSVLEEVMVNDDYSGLDGISLVTGGHTIQSVYVLFEVLYWLLIGTKNTHVFEAYPETTTNSYGILEKDLGSSLQGVLKRSKMYARVLYLAQQCGSFYTLKGLYSQPSDKEQNTKLSTYLVRNSTLNSVIPVTEGPVKEHFTEVSEINCKIEKLPLSAPSVRKNIDFECLKCAEPLRCASCLEIKQHKAPFDEEKVIIYHNAHKSCTLVREKDTSWACTKGSDIEVDTETECSENDSGFFFEDVDSNSIDEDECHMLEESCIFVRGKNTSRACAKILDIVLDGGTESSDNNSGFVSEDVDSDFINEDECHISEHSYNESDKVKVKENSSFLFGKDGDENDSVHIELSKPESFCGNSLPLSSPNEIIDEARVPATEEIEQPVLLEKQIGPFMKSNNKETYRMKVVATDELSLSLVRQQLRKDPRASLLEGLFHSLPVRESKGSDKKKIDAVCHKKDFLKSVWGMYDVLPVPKIEITVAFKEAAEVQVQSSLARQQAVNPNFEPLDVIIKKIADDDAPGPQITMRYEMLRICTLRNYPKDNKPWLTQLAAAGFYYAAEGDEVICYCCGLRRHSWVSTDVPERIHQRINPNCKFLNRNSEFNVPIRYEGTTPNMEKIEAVLNLLQEEEIPSAITNGAEGGSDVSEYTAPLPKGSKELQSPKHPQYISKQQRISSFDGWPDSLTQTPEIMAEAGFYYAGFGDCVRCYYCGIGLRHWTKEDNPWIEHARWSQHCTFVKQVKGQEFINLVQMAVEVSQNNENQESPSSSEPTGESSERSQREQDEVENILRTDPAQSVLEMGYQPRVIKKAIDFILKREGKSGISSLKIMEKVLEYEDAESARDLVGELAHMDLNRQDSASGGPPSGGSVESRETREAQARSSAKTSEKNSKPKHSNHSDPNRPTAKDIKEENHRLKEQTLCKVCLDNTVCIVFLPCGHLCTCDDCAPAMRTCPICRKDVKGTVKTYMS